MGGGRARRRVLIAACCCAGVAAMILVGVRIWQVNANAPSVPVEYCQMNQWVDLDGSFFDSASEDDMEGYALRVSGAELMSAREFAERCGSPECDDGTLDGDGGDADDAVLCLTFDVRKEGRGQGGIPLYKQQVVPASKNMALSYDSELWICAHPEFEGLPGGFALADDSAFTVHVPFSVLGDVGYFESYGGEQRMALSASSYELLLCNAPVRKVVRIEVAQ